MKIDPKIESSIKRQVYVSLLCVRWNRKSLNLEVEQKSKYVNYNDSYLRHDNILQNLVNFR